MRIIGIKVLKGLGKAKSPSEVMKALHAGWFPLGDYSEPYRRNNRWKIVFSTTTNQGLYNLLFSELPNISVCGIVGKNGSGKSTLIDYLMMIVNNAASILLSDQYGDSEEKPTMAFGVYGELYYEAEGKICRLKCCNESVYFSDGGQDKDITNLGEDEKARLRSHLSFMVLINYGVYSLNPNDYDTEDEESDANGDWLQQLFSIEQNYIYPIAITPERRNGNIDINEHQRTEKEKLVALMMYAQVKGNRFMDEYSPVKITYSFNKSLTTELSNRLGKMADDEQIGVDYLMGVKSALLVGWTECLDCTDLWAKEPDTDEQEAKEVFDAILEYMACQTVMLCAYYVKFRNVFDFLAKVRDNEIGHGVLLSNVEHMPEIMECGLFDVIMQDETTMTFGIRRCLNTIEETKRRGLKRIPFLQKNGRLPIASFANAYSLEDVLFLLPPPVYNLDIVLKKDVIDGELVEDDNRERVRAPRMTFSKLSSGEKQQLLSMASTLFHVKSVEESIAKTKGFGYKDVCLVFDEAELYFHPDFQRGFIYKMLKYLSWLGLTRSGWVENIQIIIATHSPFILSDIPRGNILFLKDGKNYMDGLGRLDRSVFLRKNTFGANYYDMLRNGFFLEDNAIGLYASEVIKRVIAVYHEKDPQKCRQYFRENAKLLSDISKMVGDEYLRSVLLRMTNEMNKAYRGND